MADLNAIRAGLATALETVTALNVAQEHPDQLVPPQAVIGLPEDIDYHYTVGTTGLEAVIPVFIYVQRVAVRTAQRLLMDFLSTGTTNSIPDAIKADITLGGVVDYCVMQRVRDQGRYTVGGNDYIGAEIVLEVKASA